MKRLALVLPGVGLAAVAALVPLIEVGSEVISASGVDLFLAHFHAPSRVSVLVRSIGLAAGVAVVATAVGLAVALATLARAVALRRLAWACLAVPLAVHPLAFAFGYAHVIRYGSARALIDAAFAFAGARGGAWASVAGVMVVMLFPYCGWLAAVSMEMVPRAERLAAWNAGYSRVHILWRLILPRTRDALGAGGLLVFTHALGYFIVPILAGDGWVNTLAVQISDRVEAGMIGQAAAMALALLTVTTLVMTLAIARLLRTYEQRDARRGG